MNDSTIKEIDRKRELILNGNLYKVIIKLSLPIMLSNFIQTLYNLADTYFVSKMGETQMNAIGVVWPLVFAFIGLGTGLSLGAVALISKYIGANDKEKAKRTSGQIISFLFIVGIIMAAIGYIVAPAILKAMGVTGETYNLAVQYLNIIYLGVPFMYLFFAFQAIEQAQGNMLLPMIFSGVSVVINIILDPIFIFVLDLGVQGAAVATIITRIALGAGGMIYYFASKNTQYKPSFRELRPDIRIIKKISKIGVPASLGQVTSAVGFMVINSLVLSYGANVLSAFIVGNRIVSLAMMPCMGIGSALSTIVGQNLGAGNIKRTKQTLYKTIQVGFAFAAIGIGILLAIGDTFINIFTDDINVIVHAKEYVLIITLAMPLMSLFNIWIGFFIGAGKGTFSMIVMMSRLWIYRLPSIIVLKYVFHINEYAIWYPMIISNVLACLTGYLIYKKGNIFGAFMNKQASTPTIKET